MIYKVVSLVGAGRVKSQRLSIFYKDEEDYDWTSGDRDKKLATAISRKIGIPAKHLTVQFFRWETNVPSLIDQL